MTMFKAHARRGEPVEMWRLIRLAAVRRHGFITKIIRHDENDVGFALGSPNHAGEQDTNEAGSGEAAAENGRVDFHGGLKRVIHFTSMGDQWPSRTSGLFPDGGNELFTAERSWVASSRNVVAWTVASARFVNSRGSFA